MPAVIPVFGDHADPVLAGQSATVLGTGLESLLDTNSLDPAHIDALVHTAFSADDFSRRLRDLLSPGDIPGFGTIPALSARLAAGCVNGITGALGRLGSQALATQEAAEWARAHPPTISTREIISLELPRGCPGGQVTLHGSGFGVPDALAFVAFTGANGGPLLATSAPGSWTDTEITVTVPDGVATGPVGVIRFQRGGPSGGDPLGAMADVISEVSTCLGLAGAIAGQRLARVAEGSFAGMPGLLHIRGAAGDPNWFVGGRPIIRSFAVNGNATPALVGPGETLTLTWEVENADTVEIVPVRAVLGDRNELPPIPGPVDPASGDWTSPPIPVDWAWDGGYELRATNLCSLGQPTRIRVDVRGMPAAPSFLWGVALAAGQYEGGLDNDWNAWMSHANSVEHMEYVAAQGTPPTVLHPEPIGVGMRHEDALSAAQEIGRAHTMRLNAYRFSMDWSRLEPARGQLDTIVLDTLYLPMLRTMRAAGIEPVVTLHHLSNPLWVLTPPQDLSRFGVPPSMLEDSPFQASLRGWENSETVDAFVDFVSSVVSYIKQQMGPDTPTWWITLNEPIGSIGGSGYAAGIWPPGFTAAGPKLKTVYENLVRAHFRARKAIKAVLPSSKVGVAQNVAVAMAEPGGLPGDNQGAATQTEYFYVWHSLDAWHFGTYDDDFERRPNARTNVEPAGKFFGVAPGDWQSSLDFVGVNYYRSWWVRAAGSVQVGAAMGFSGGIPLSSLDVMTQETAHLNDLYWRVDPGAFLGVLRRIRDAYNLPVLITENGMADATDRQRASYTVAHADVLRRAMDEGVDVRGYLHWSITDNWEWHMTYQPEARFGLYAVDRTQQDSGRLTLPRRPTESALALACLANGLPTDIAATRFGSFADDGASYIVPTRSACRAWSGQTADGTSWQLVLADLTGGRMLGWMRDSVTTKWVALDQLSGRPSTYVAGAHRRGWGFAEREANFAANGQDLVGSITTVGLATLPVTLTRDAFVGTWLGGPWPMVLFPFGLWEKGRPDEPASPAQPATPYVGRWLSPSHPTLDGTWLPLTASPGNGGVLTLALGSVMSATVTATSGMLTGTVTSVLPVPGLPVPAGMVTWTRGLDDLG